MLVKDLHADWLQQAGRLERKQKEHEGWERTREEHLS